MKKAFIFLVIILISAGVALAGEKRFIKNKDGTVTDTKTGLIWTRNANIAGKGMNWHEAMDFISELNQKAYLGYNDWRLPEIEELETLTEQREGLPKIPYDLGKYPFIEASDKLIKSKPTLPKGHPFKNVVSYWYWAKTVSPD